ncbi:signal peptidase I [Carboxylicivirga marina]|uniref:Signal peptidase I n=1 Tax=Carboxylicivirga marina TaxID=2800988 RepID=A0ABS1HPI9_9BACT|nr:signal peptidase I [Carboxylicivirga marina]MBK3519609.1 signal peptidase I [Carboxylicivirga marina]
MKLLKTGIQYIFILALLLLTIWSQSWLLFAVLVFTCLASWLPLGQQILSWIKDKIPSIAYLVLEWLLAFALSGFVIWFVNAYIISFYTVKASSMLPSVGNSELVVINKMAYGPAIHINKCQHYRRMNGYSQMQNGEIIAFYFPEGDTSFVDFENEDYHYIKRQFETTNNYNALLDNAIKYNKVDERQVYIKRLIALPGDTLQISKGDYVVNGNAFEQNPLLSARYELIKNTPNKIREEILNKASTSYRENGSQLIEMQTSIINNNNWHFHLNRVEEVMNMPNINVFPFKANYLWNASWMGPLIMPTKGKTVRLTQTNLALYRRIIESYEENTLSLKDNEIFINNKKVSKYTFKMNYYWVGGDNKKHSFDSRYWGFVPENHIIGRVKKLSEK